VSETDQAVAGSAIEARIDDLLEARTRHNHAFFASHAGRLARLCHAMAERFASGGRLVALAASPAGRSDARHVAVEFVHPVIVGKRALPAIALAPEGGGLAVQAGVILEPEDIAIAFGEDGAGEVREALAIGRDRGCLTIAFTAVGAEWELEVPGDDPFIRQELVETLYHVLWELVHVFLEHRGAHAGREESAGHDAGASSFLYPFLAEAESDLEAVAADVERSILMKADEVGALRRQTLTDNRHVLLRAARELRDRLDAGGKVLAFGNGGSATDAMDLVADLREPPRGDWPSRTAIDLTEDASILTAIANDVGVEKIFQRQVIAYGGSGDAAVALSTSGNSVNLIEALEECRRRGLATIALVGYDGGRIAAEELADHLVLTRSQHIPRIQEAQASAYHVLRELIELVGARA
jgi:D-sedoheptulose 7-phosphate isomerase